MVALKAQGENGLAWLSRGPVANYSNGLPENSTTVAHGGNRGG